MSAAGKMISVRNRRVRRQRRANQSTKTRVYRPLAPEL